MPQICWGLDESIRVFNGAHDQYCASVGCGAVKPGDVMLSTGTAWVLLGISDRLVFNDSGLVPGIHPLGGPRGGSVYGVMASLGGVGNSLRWLRDTVGGSYASLDEGRD